MKAVLLDALGTLLRLDAPVDRLRAELLARHGLVVGEREAGLAFRAEMSFYRANLWRGVDARGLSELRDDCAALVARELRIEEDVREALLAAIVFVPFPEVVATLERWRGEGRRLVVASNWDISLHEALSRTGLSSLLDGAVSSAEAGSAKPAPEVFLRALEIAGVDAAEATHVGDDLEADYLGAQAAQIAPVLLVREGEPAAPEGVRSIATLDALHLGAC